MVFVNVESLMQQVSLEQAVAFYRIELPEIHRIGEEIRMRCFLNCGRGEETGERALSIQPEHPAKIWRCHQAGCGKGGNLVSLCDLMKPGATCRRETAWRPVQGNTGRSPGDHIGCSTAKIADDLA